MEESSLFSQYEQEYCKKSTEAFQKISLVATLSGEARGSKLREIDGDIQDAEQILSRLDMEARSASPATSRAMMQKVKEYRADVGKLRADRRTVAAAQGPGPTPESRAELGLGDDYYTTSAGQRDRLLTATDRLNKTSDRITSGRQQLAETEDLGIQILSDLQRQRETILHSRDTLGGVDENISRSRAVLSSMSRRILQNKLIMWGIALLLLAGIALVLWSKTR